MSGIWAHDPNAQNLRMRAVETQNPQSPQCIPPARFSRLFHIEMDRSCMLGSGIPSPVFALFTFNYFQSRRHPFIEWMPNGSEIIKGANDIIKPTRWKRGIQEFVADYLTGSV